MTLQKLLQIEAELRKAYFERDEEVHGSIVALLARQHVLLLGPPGTAKSQLVEDMCARIQLVPLKFPSSELFNILIEVNN